MPVKPHLRLYTDGKLYLWRGKLMGWKLVGEILNHKVNLRRTGWPVPHAGRPHGEVRYR